MASYPGDNLSISQLLEALDRKLNPDSYQCVLRFKPHRQTNLIPSDGKKIGLEVRTAYGTDRHWLTPG
jgi:hypothetical protein